MKIVILIDAHSSDTIESFLTYMKAQVHKWGEKDTLLADSYWLDGDEEAHFKIFDQ